MVDLSTNAETLEGMARWMEEQGFESIAQMQGNL